MTENINTIPQKGGTSELDFSWNPTDGQFSYVVGTDTVIPDGANYTAINTEITFTASSTLLPYERTVDEYFWDFGDGTTGLGASVDHTYVIANLQAACVLRITDDLGNQYFCRHQLYLHESDD